MNFCTSWCFWVYMFDGVFSEPSTTPVCIAW